MKSWVCCDRSKTEEYLRLNFGSGHVRLGSPGRHMSKKVHKCRRRVLFLEPGRQVSIWLLRRIGQRASAVFQKGQVRCIYGCKDTECFLSIDRVYFI